MGPSNSAERDALYDNLRRLRVFRLSHPDVIITYPSESLSGLWEVSLPGASAMAFDNLDTLLAALDAE